MYVCVRVCMQKWKWGAQFDLYDPMRARLPRMSRRTVDRVRKKGREKKFHPFSRIIVPLSFRTLCSLARSLVRESNDGSSVFVDFLLVREKEEEEEEEEERRRYFYFNSFRRKRHGFFLRARKKMEN